MFANSVKHSRQMLAGLGRRAFQNSVINAKPQNTTVSNVGLGAVIGRNRLERDEFKDVIQDTQALAIGVDRLTVGDALAKKKAEQRGAWLWVDVDATALSAVQEMTRNNVGALLVMRKDVLDVNKDGRVSKEELASGSWHDAVAGVVSERDYLKKIVMENRSGSGIKVGDIMTSKDKITVATTETPVLEALRVMSEGRFRHMPVVNDDSTMAGMLCIGDVTRMVLNEHHKEVHRLRDYLTGGYGMTPN